MLLAAVAVVGSVQASPIPPDAISDVLAAANGERNFQNRFPGTAFVSTGGCTDFAGDIGTGCGSAEASTLGFFNTAVPGPGVLTLKDLGQAKVKGDVSIASGPQFEAAVRTDASAHLSYYVGVIPNCATFPTCPPVSAPHFPVDIDVSFLLHGIGTETGGGHTTSAQISVSVNGFNMGGAFCGFRRRPISVPN
jgi:hypothetical protein